MVKEGGKKPGLPPRGVFVVVVVVVTDKDCGGNRRGWRRHAQNITPKGSCCRLVRGRWQGWRQWHWHYRTSDQNLTPTLAIVARRLRSRAFASLTAHKALHAKARGKDGMPDVEGLAAAAAAAWR
ncbi:MAG: hypothetical protein J0L63_19500 [Anaerolineae bacterium]|nr:hypothetical protein [Anaerolineae bacterium]